MSLEPESKLQLSDRRVFLLCSDSLVTNGSFMALRSSSLLYFGSSRVNSICTPVITGISNEDFSMNAFIGGACRIPILCNERAPVSQGAHLPFPDLALV